MPGAANLDASPLTDRLISKTMSDGGFLCAICAAPMVYGKRKLLAGVKATCFPGFEKHLTGALLTDKKVVRDRKFITAAGMGAAFDYGIELVSALCGEESASTLRQRVQAP